MNNILDLNNVPVNVLSKELTSYNFLLYSLPGMGKTTFAVETFDKERTLLLAFEIGSKGIVGARPVPIPDYATFLRYVDQLCTEEIRKKYDTLIIDTATKLGECIEEYILSTFGKLSLGDCKAHGGAYPLINRYWNMAMDRIKSMGYNIVYICHANEESIKNEKGEEIEKYYSPKLSNRIAGLIEPETDYTFFLCLNKKNERIIVTDNTIKNKGKHRTPLPTIIPMDSEIFKKEFINGIEKKSNGTATNERIKSTVNEYKAEERDYKVVVAEIKELGNKAKEVGKMKEALEIVNLGLGTNDDNSQRTLDMASQVNIQMLEVIKDKLEKLLAQSEEVK